MSNRVFCETSGKIILKPAVTEEMVKTILEETQGDWRIEEDGGNTVLQYDFWDDGSCSSLPDPDVALQRLVEQGYNLAAWRATFSFSSEDWGGSSSSELRGTPEQQRLFRLQEIDKQISELGKECDELLVC